MKRFLSILFLRVLVLRPVAHAHEKADRRDAGLFEDAALAGLGG